MLARIAKVVLLCRTLTAGGAARVAGGGGRVLVVALVVLGVAIPVAVAADSKSGHQRAFVDVPSLAERPESQRPSPDIASIAAQMTDAKERRGKRRDWLATPAQREERRASRRAFTDLGPVGALRVAREEQPGVVSAPVWRPLQLRAGERIDGYLNDHTMRIDREGESSDGLAYSLDPFVAPDEQGRKRAVDLSLEREQTGFSPANSPVDLRMPDRLADGIELTSLGISVRPQLLDGASPGSEVGGKVFYANVAPDTDFMSAPVPSGVETFHVLRSQSSPESLPLLFDLPAGARVRAASTSASQQRPIAFEIVRGEDVIATVSKPTAFDADGEVVPVEAELDGSDRVTLHVAHREADVKYPIMVDPVVGDVVQEDFKWREGFTTFAGWNFGSAPYNYFVGSAGLGTAGNGLYIYAFPNGAYSAGQYAQWAAFAPGTSYIYRAEFGYVNHVPGNSQVYDGIYSVTQGRWEESFVSAGSLSNNWRTSCVANCAWVGTPGNAMVFGMQMMGPSPSYGTFGAAVFMGYAIMMLHDDDVPSITVAHSGLPSGWTNKATIHTAVTSADPGLGVAAVAIQSDTDEYSELIAAGCGDRFFRCPNTTSIPFDYTADEGEEGVHTIAALARDAINHTTISAPWTLKIDRTAPSMSIGGSLATMKGKELSEDAYKLTIDALDDNEDHAIVRAGVKSIEIRLDGERAFYAEQPEQACPGTGCAMRRDWEFKPFAEDLAVGEHTLQVVVTDHAGNQNVQSAWKVRIARGAMTSPHEGDISEKRFNLRAVAKRPGFSTATFVYRRSSTQSWTTIPAAQLKTVAGASVAGTSQPLTGGATPTLVWDAATALQGADTPVQIRALFDGEPITPSTTVNASYKPNGVGADYARETIGPGSIDLLTGNFLRSEDDASIDSFASDLTIRRTYASRMAQPAAGQPAGAFGPGWLASAPVRAAGADYVKLDDATSSVTLMLADTTTVQFAATPTSGYDPQAGYEDLELTKNASTGAFTLTDSAGDKTVFTQIQGSEYRPATASSPGSETTTDYEYSVVGGEVRLTRVLAPRPAGVTSCAPLVAGCRELRFTYATSTTATGTALAQWGDYTSRLVSVTFGSGADGGTNETVARYQYDSEGRLRAAWDPRITPALKTSYDYDTSGLLIKVTPPGEQPWTLTYQSIASDPAAGRLKTVTRVGPAGTATWTAVYDVPLAGTGAPYAMGAADVARWAQSDAPVDATAIFGPDQVPGSGTPTSYSRATVHYLNGSGRDVNTVLPGGNISTSEYDEHHNVVRTLTAANRQRALAATDTAARAREIDTVSTYDSTGLELRDVLEPRHEIRVADGSTVQARKHTVTTYDAGDLHLPTLVRTGAHIDGQATDADVRTTTYAYDDIGKAQRKPTATTADPDGLKLTTKVAYDAGTGLPVSRTLPAGNGSDARTTKTIYYSAAANPDEPTCGGKPAWAELVCKTKPAAQPTGSLPAIPTTTFEYNRLSQPTRVSDTTGSATRTRTTTYDVAGRLATEATTATTGNDLPMVTHVYSSTTGRETSTGTSTKTITRVFDSLGRQTSHTDADGVKTTTAYDLLDRPVTINDTKATETLVYDSTRGLLTSVADPQVGTLGATYDADGAVATKTYPNGLTATITTDEAGERTKLRYLKANNCGTTCEWLLSQAAISIHGQQTWQSTTTQAGPMSTDDYTYDAAGRLKNVNDRTGSPAACTVRTYGYDANSNRTGLETFAPATGGACQTTAASSTQNNTYDEADRITNTGFDYDTFGRTQIVPAPRAGGTQLTSTYYANDLVRTLSQDGTTRTYTLDPARRVSTRATTTASTTTTETYHYTNTRDNGLDSPAWIAENAATTTYTRMIDGPDGDLAAIRDGAGTRLQLTNLHDDIVAEASTNASTTKLTVLGDATEFGTPRQQSDRRRTWLGGENRSTDLRSGVMTMGVRTYVPGIGRFLQTDPIRGGSANDYDYVNQDPVNNYDLSGRVCIWKCIKRIVRKTKKIVLYPVRDAKARRGLVEIVGGGLGTLAGAVSFGACALLGGEIDLAAHCYLPTGTVMGAGIMLIGDGVHRINDQNRRGL
jgi:RHS repeat-associated protein